MNPIIIDNEFLKNRPLSYSSLKAFAQSPAHYISYLNAPRKQTPALLFGNIVDCIVLTPDKFKERFVVKPEFKLSRKYGTTKTEKEAKAIELASLAIVEQNWRDENADKTWIKIEMIDEATLIKDAIDKNQASSEMLLRWTKKQLKLSWEQKFMSGDEEFKLPMIAYLDGAGDEVIGDLKTCQRSFPIDFIKDAYNYDYHLQAAIYLEGYSSVWHKYPPFFHIAAEKSEPYGVSVLKADSNFIKLGKQQFERLLQEFKMCMDNNLWHMSYDFRTTWGYSELTLPGYALNLIQK